MIKQKELVPKRRFEGFDGEWKSYKFDDLAEILRGASPRPIQDPKWFDKNSDVGWLRISDVTEQNGKIEYLEQRLSKLGEEKTRVLYEPHLLLSIAATVGKPLINYVKTGVHDGFLIFRKPKFNLQYMYQWLEMFRPDWNKYGQPGSQVNLNSEIVKNQIIMLPDSKEQKKIGQFFKHLDNMIALEQRKIDKTKALKSAYLAEMFPAEGENVPKRRFVRFTDKWKKYQLRDIADITTGKAFSSSEFSDKGDYLVITNKNIKDQTKNIESTGSRINISDKSIIENYLLSGNNILITMDGNVGRTGKYSNNKAVLAQRVARIRSDQLEFIYQITRSDKFVAKMNEVSVGNIIKHISLTQISDYSFMAPENEDEQEKIGEFFKNLDQILATYDHKLEKLKATKQAYLHEMFV